jgi:hypothetical protein
VNFSFICVEWAETSSAYIASSCPGACPGCDMSESENGYGQVVLCFHVMWTSVWLETIEEGTYHWNIWGTYTTLCLFQNVWHISLISLTLAHYMNDWVQSLNANSTPLLYIYKLEKLWVEILWCFFYMEILWC